MKGLVIENWLTYNLIDNLVDEFVYPYENYYSYFLNVFFFFQKERNLLPPFVFVRVIFYQSKVENEE